MVSGHVLTSLWGQYNFKIRLDLIPLSPSLIISHHSPLYPSNKEERVQWLHFTVPFVIASVNVIGFNALGHYLVSFMFKFTIIKTCPAGFTCTHLTLSAPGKWMYVLSCGWRPDPAWSLTSLYMSAPVFLLIFFASRPEEWRNTFVSCNECRLERPKKVANSLCVGNITTYTKFVSHMSYVSVMCRSHCALYTDPLYIYCEILLKLG